MKTEKRLIAFSVLALMIGVASVTPLLFFMSGTAKAETTIEPWFSYNCPYAYLVANTTALPNGTFTYGMWHALVSNSTIKIDAVADSTADAQIDYFQMQIYSDAGPIENTTYSFGTNRTSNFDISPYTLMMNNLIESNISSGVGTFWFGSAYSYNEPSLSVHSGSSSGQRPLEASNSSAEVTQVRNLENAQTVYIDIRRLGSVTFNGNYSVITLASSEVLQHIELQKFGDGFLYNTLLPEDQWSQIDLLKPLRYLAQQEP
ncbi:MAG: hypothetical protein NWF05_10020 [Candidatus Bathyarchaeota archaeon]|nr:hypothetical protein [Candidatus Bathyarchaeota archaeon]